MVIKNGRNYIKIIVLQEPGTSLKIKANDKYSVNLQFNMVERWDDDMIVPPSDGPMFILID